MNILVLTSAYPQPDDGEEVVTPTVKYFAEKWSKLGHNVIVIHTSSCFPAVLYCLSEQKRQKLSSKLGHSLPTNASRHYLEYEDGKLLVSRMPMKKVIPHGKFSSKNLRKQAKRIIVLLEKHEFVPEVIVGHWANPQSDLLRILMTKYPEARTSLVFHGDCTDTNIERFSLISLADKLTAIGCRNKSYAMYVQNALHLSKMPFICYSGIPDQLADECLKNIDIREYSDHPEFVYVGRLVKYKNVDTIIEALYRVFGDQYFKLHIVGSGAEKDRLAELAKTYRVDDRVIFYGQVSREESLNIMRMSNYFIMVSERETFGMVYIEAMLAGCITIASLNGGIDGVIVDGENGFLSEEGNTVALAEKIRKIGALDIDRKIEIRKNAIRTAAAFSDTDVAKKYLQEVVEN